MSNSKKLYLGIVAVVVILGLGYFLPHSAKKFGENTTNYPEWFYNGLSAGNPTVGNTQQGSAWSVSTSGAMSTTATFTATSLVSANDFNSASVGLSSSSPAALGSAIAGHFIIAAGQSTAQASTTTVTLNSSIFLEQELTSPIPGTTCNTVIASDTVVSTKVAGNGFTVTNSYAPATNPQCEAYWIIN